MFASGEIYIKWDRTHATQEFDTVVRLMNASTQQQLPRGDGLVGCRGKATRVNPVLYAVQVDGRICLLVSVSHQGAFRNYIRTRRKM